MKGQRKKKGISTVIANVLMVAIVVTLGNLLFIWASGSLSGFQSSATIFFESRGQSMREAFVIEDVWFDNSGARIVVRNVGALTLTLAAIYINGTQVWSGNQEVNVRQASAPITISSSSIPNYSLSGPKAYYISLASLRGNYVREYWRAS